MNSGEEAKKIIFGWPGLELMNDDNIRGTDVASDAGEVQELREEKVYNQITFGGGEIPENEYDHAKDISITRFPDDISGV